MKNENITVIGLQWGDEGKGKIVDYLSRSVRYGVRFNGGANAGHTVVREKGKTVLHLLPTSILWPQTRCLIGAGVVCDPKTLLEELEQMRRFGIETDGRVGIDYATHLVLPHHQALDKYGEAQSGAQAIATTLRGIGPAYADRALRVGLVAADLLDEENLRLRIDNFLRRKQAEVSPLGDPALNDFQQLHEYLKPLATQIAPLLCDVTKELRKALTEKEPILFEGSQGTLLDLGLGSYPFVTASTTTIGGLFAGLGLPPGSQGEVVGVIKAYTTRVGNGPFPTELDNRLGDHLRVRGGEYGATTGRPRRTGWLDLATVKKAAFVNGVNWIAITKLDVLDELPEIKICVGYQTPNGIDDFPSLVAPLLTQAKPIYKTLPGWQTSTADLTTIDRLPIGTRRFIDCIQTELGLPIRLISTGPHTNSVIEIA